MSYYLVIYDVKKNTFREVSVYAFFRDELELVLSWPSGMDYTENGNPMVYLGLL